MPLSKETTTVVSVEKDELDIVPNIVPGVDAVIFILLPA